MKIKWKWAWGYEIFTCLLIGLLFIKYVLQINIPSIVFILLIVLMALIGNINQTIAIIVANALLTKLIPYGYALIFVLCIFVFKYKKRINVNFTLVLFLMMVIWELLHGAFGIFSLSKLVVTFTHFIIICFWAMIDIKELDYAYIVRHFSIYACSVCVIMLGLIIVQANYDFQKAFYYMQRLGGMKDEYQLLKFEINPNSLGIMCVLAITVLLQLYFLKKSKKIDILLILFLLLCGTLTMSKTYLVLLCLMLLLFAFAQPDSWKNFGKYSVLIVICGIAVVEVLNLWFPNVLESFMARFLVEDLSTGRVDLFYAYNEYLFSDLSILFFGIGLTDFSEQILLTGIRNSPHNCIQELLLSWGVIGGMLFLAFGATAIYYAQRFSKKNMLINWIPLILILVKAMAGQLITSDYTMLLLSLAYLSLLTDFNKHY